PIGPLREALAYPGASANFSDQQLTETLIKVGLPGLANRLDDNENWQMRLSGGEQQRLRGARAAIGHQATINQFHKRRITFESQDGGPATVSAEPKPAT